ncbi:pentatricopeptide repeat-containing protein At2g22070 [Macadamia integrifolia]|uniref:pentatricopeptide repeat-containing protein At2g22070 n=1 Tax=Macadamia integrifolia TaxID=60698 RepID=UPI001C4EB124|nr:pentatricopeptide repeat-containing protein At2g22070 [Macadamia integrifolia]
MSLTDRSTSSSLLSIPDFYASLLQTSLKSNNSVSGKLVHARTIKAGLHISVFLVNNLINFYAKSGLLSDAHRLFNEMPLKNTFSWNTILSVYAKQGRIGTARQIFEEMPHRDSVSWTAMIVGYNQMGCFEDAIRMFLEMNLAGVPPTQFTFTNILTSCVAIEALDIGKKVHSFILKLGLSSYIPVANSLLNMYGKSGDLIVAKMVFDRMTLKNTSSWNAMITLHAQSDRLDLALAQFEQMTERDIVSWNSMIAGYNQHRCDLKALTFFKRMLNESSVKPDSFTFASALSACANLEMLKHGKQIHAQIIRTGLDTYGPVGNALISMYSKSGGVKIARKIVSKIAATNLSVISFTALLDGYIKLGDISPARQIFDSMKDHDVVAWTAMIVGYTQNGFHDDAVALFRSMVNEGPKPNNYTLAAMLSVCSSLASLEHGKQIHAISVRFGEELSVSVSNALITMYAKAGSIEGAKCVFNQICWTRDTISWTSMIIALAQHGMGEEAVELFEKMLTVGVQPDHITYVGVLSACTHAGLVEQGQNYFNLMQSVHRILPTQSHYACMIDLLGRGGLLQEAQNFIEKMPVEPDVIAWGALLSSCKVHKNVDFAKIAAENLLIIDPENSGAYSALANVYSACGRWEDAAKVRKLMKDRGVKKDQGFSWIQIKNKVHVFGVEDGLHPQKDAIYQAIAKLWEEIKKMGFIPDTESVLHDLEEELKEQILSHHSEKLALAFGLISTPGNMTLRILKNLRVCNDCHLAFKFISKLVGREIILRDATRFHHFKDGSCSCQDYW